MSAKPKSVPAHIKKLLVSYGCSRPEGSYEVIQEINYRIPPPRFAGGAWFYAHDDDGDDP